MPNTRRPLGDDYSKITLEEHCASDLSVVNAARVSFAKQSLEYGSTEQGILRFLMRQQHGTPFEHNYFKFKVRAPIVVIWEWVRHRIGVSYNVESGRYTELKGDFYVPKELRTQVGKPGSYSFAPLVDETARFWIESHSRTSFQLYQDLLTRGVAKEQARLVLPMTIYSEFYFTCNARSLMNFVALRNEEHAMLEIRKYGEAIEDLWSQAMPDTAQAFISNGRKAP